MADLAPLIFTMGANGFAGAYRDCLRSQRAYARRMGFDHQLFAPRYRLEPIEAAWLKIPVLRRELERRPWVWALDVDAEVRDGCPDFRSVEKAGKDLYMAVGRSGRVNSGVIIARRSPAAIEFLDTVLAHADEPVPAEDRTRFENGHVIYYSRGRELVEILPQQWNNTESPRDDDHVRHYTGPMRELRPAKRSALVTARARSLLARRPEGLDGRPLSERVARLADVIVPR